jgi:hypothetical protein
MIVYAVVDDALSPDFPLERRGAWSFHAPLRVRNQAVGLKAWLKP